MGRRWYVPHSYKLSELLGGRGFQGCGCGRAFDHGAARKPERYRRTDGNILSYRNGHRSTQLSVEKERGSCQRRNFGAQFTVAVGNSAGSVTSSAATLTVNAATYLLSASPASLGFGNVDIGSNSSLGATLTNNGNSNVTISGVTITGAGFSTSRVTSGTILSPNQSATVTAAFAPTVAQNFTGSVGVTSNATNSPAPIPLTELDVQPPPPSFPPLLAPSLVG